MDAAAQPDFRKKGAAWEAACTEPDPAPINGGTLLALATQASSEQRKLAVADWSPFHCQADTRCFDRQDEDDDLEGPTAEGELPSGVSSREEQKQVGSAGRPDERIELQAPAQGEASAASPSGTRGETTESDSELEAADVFADSGGNSRQRWIARQSQLVKPPKRRRQCSEQAGGSDALKKPRYFLTQGFGTPLDRQLSQNGSARAEGDSQGQGLRSPGGRECPEAGAAEALEVIRRTGSSKLPVITTGMPGPPSQQSSAQVTTVTAVMRKYPGELQAMAQILQAQQVLVASNAPPLQPSPFQDHPESPPKAHAASGPLMRNCFSETSADKLTAGLRNGLGLTLQPGGLGALAARQEGSNQSSQARVSLAALLQTANSCSSQGGSEHLFPASSSTPPSMRLATGQLPASSPFCSTAHAKDSKQQDMEAMEGLYNKLGVAAGFLLPSTASGPDKRDAKDVDTMAARAQGLSSFGSLISSAIEASRTQSVPVPSPSRGGSINSIIGTGSKAHAPRTHSNTAALQASAEPATSLAQPSTTSWAMKKATGKPASKKESLQGPLPATVCNHSVGGTLSSFTPFGDRASSPIKAQSSAAMPSIAPAAVSVGMQPDPRILEWVLGAHSQTSDSAKGTQLPRLAAQSADLDKLLSRQHTAEGVGIRGASMSAATTKEPAPPEPTLRRPIAIRPSEVRKEPLALPNRSRSEGVLDGFGSLGAAAASPTVEAGLPPRSRTSSQTLTELALLAQQTLTSGDLGRVMQWAGRELALRDKKVREAEAAQTEERNAHNAALSAVGAEVSRLKRGQAELAVTHWKMQESLAQKTAELEDKGNLVAQLSRGLAEMTTTGLRAAKDRQRLQTLSEQLASALARRNTQVLTQVKQLEDWLDQGSVEEAKALLTSFRRGLEAPAVLDEPSPRAAVAVPQPGPVTSA